MKIDRTEVLYPRVRMDALTDGIYAVAMTLLILDVRLPEDFHPVNDGQLLQGLFDLSSRLFPYLLSFGVLGLRWLAGLQVRSRAERVGGPYVRWWVLHLLLITCVPFTTIVVGRYALFAPAAWLYAGNTALISVASWYQLKYLPEVENDHYRQSRQASHLLLFASAVLCIVWSFFSPQHALWAFMLNLAGPALRYRRQAAGAPSSG